MTTGVYDTWKIVNASHDAHALGQFSSVCTVSNGYLGLSGHLAEQRDGTCPLTLINGVFDELDMFGLLRPSNEERRYLDARYFDGAPKSPAIANLANPLFVQTFVGEQELSIGRGQISAFSQELDLRSGVYRYAFDYRDSGGRTTRVAMERFASLEHAHRVFMRYTLTPLDHEDAIRVHSGIDGRVRAHATDERQFSVTERWAHPPERCRMTLRTPARGHEIRMGVAHVVKLDQPGGSPAGVAEHDAVYTRYTFGCPARGSPIVIERYVVLVCSEDLRHKVIADLDAELDAAIVQGFDGALAAQAAAWDRLWRQCDVEIDGDDPAQLGLRFCLYHLLAAAPRFSERLSVPVKLLTGDHYQGTTFYDTDLYIVPFYTFVVPELARRCLNFRYEGLRPARETARSLGYAGAKFAWQAGPNGEECLGRWWRFTHTNIHINADVAYALVQYCRATGDQRFMAERGVDILVETARFYATRAELDAREGGYHLPDVAGPDEGHCESTDNFYTNALARRNLRWAADEVDNLARTMPGAHAAAVRRLALRPEEPAVWRQVADRLALLGDAQTGVFEQCAGFFQLKLPPPDLLENRKTWFVTVAPYQALNQPDVVMALVLLRDEFDLEVRRANWEYYKDKSLNFSSMSFAINALMALDVGDLAEAYRNFIITTGIDLDEALTGRKDTDAGLHGTALGGAWLTAVCGFGGVRLDAQGLRIEPRLPPAWSGLRFHLVKEGVGLHVAIDRRDVTLTAGSERTAELTIHVAGQAVRLRSGETRCVRYAL